MEFRMRMLELHNMELEQHTQTRENLTKANNEALKAVLTKVDLRDRIIAQQRVLLEKAGVSAHFVFPV